MEWVPIVAWVIVTALLAVLGAPLAAAVFRHLPGLGGAFAVHVAIVPLGLVSFWVGQFHYGWATLMVALGVLAALAVVLVTLEYLPDWRAVAEGYVAFLVGFAGAIVMRTTAPTISAAGGEQFLHFGLLKAVRRAPALPPEDMWYAGEPVRYYYGGHTIVDQIARLTGVEPAIAYNLGLALVFGLAVAAAYGLVGALVAARGRSRHLGGIAGAFALVAAGPIVTPVRLAIGQLPTDLAVEYGAFAFRAIRTSTPLPELIAEQGSISGWYWWDARYVVEGTLQEFPSYSLLKADLHGHVTTIPFMVVLAAIGYAYYRTPAGAVWRRRALAVGVFPAVAGLVGWMNAWSLPGTVGIAWLAVTLAPAHPVGLLPRAAGRRLRAWMATGSPRTEVARLGLGTATGGLVGVLGGAWVAPFVLFQLPTNDGIGLLPERSPLATQGLVWGAFFALFALLLGAAVWRAVEGRERALVGIGALVAGVALWAVGFGSLAIGLPLLVSAWWLVRTDGRLGYVGVLIVGGLGLVLSMELVYADVWPPDQQRWNTTYKVAMQAWILCALAGGAAIAILGGRALERLRSDGSWRAVATLGLVVTIVASMAVFPVLGFGGELYQYTTDPYRPDASIDGFDGLDRFRTSEMAAVRWLDDRDGRPVVLEAPGEAAYTWTNPASTLTGLPTVAGWSHQQGYRGVEAYMDRVDDVDRIYEGDRATAVQLLRTYDVEYIWVGQSERERYDTPVRTFATWPGIEVAFTNTAVTIYAVDHGGLSAADVAD